MNITMNCVRKRSTVLECGESLTTVHLPTLETEEHTGEQLKGLSGVPQKWGLKKDSQREMEMEAWSEKISRMAAGGVREFRAL